MSQRHYPEYGPIQRRRTQPGDVRRPRQMAVPMRDEPYTGATIPMRSQPRRAPQPQGRSARRRGGGWWWKVPLLLIVLLGGAAISGLAWLDRQYENRIYPNVALQDVDLSRATVAEAQTKVEASYGRFFAQPVTIAYQGRTWQPTLADIGVSIDVRRSINEAYRFGRGNGLLANLTQVATIYREGRNLPLRITVNENQLNAYLAGISAEIDKQGREATLAIADANVSSSDSVNGRMVLVDETRTEIVRGLRALKPQTIALRTSELRPQLTTEGIAEARRTVEAMLQTPMTLKFKDTTFELDQATVADMIVLQRVAQDGSSALNAQLDQEKLRKWTTKLANKIGRSSVEPRVNWNGGNLQIIREGRIGYKLDVDAAVEMINGAVATVTRELDLPVQEVQPRVTAENLNTLGIRELVSTGKSDFTGSAAYRVTNIEVGVQKMHGILIGPGDEFSFNENVGNIDAANGFVEGYAIVGNRTQLEPGGGICQDSTTLFRAAFYAGLPFTSWTPHRFRISWYEKYDTIGMDSTIFTGGGPDLRFVNDTGNWLLIQGYADRARGTVTFALYGTRVAGRTVERTQPEITNETPAPTQPVYVDDPEQPLGTFKQTDTARGGLDIEIWRVVKQNGEVLRREPFRTSFEAWPNIFVKNPKTPKPVTPPTP